MTINILFLSDLHFGVKPNDNISEFAVSERKNVLEKRLFPELKKFLIAKAIPRYVDNGQPR